MQYGVVIMQYRVVIMQYGVVIMQYGVVIIGPSCRFAEIADRKFLQLRAKITSIKVIGPTSKVIGPSIKG